jgi:hypothetical protein
MAATERRQFLKFGSLLLLGTAISEADQAADLRSQLSSVAMALTGGNPADAMTPFSKSFANYQKLRDYFIGLTNAFDIVNEVDVTDEQDAPDEILATIRWAITVSNKGNNSTNQRIADIHVRCIRERGKWRIFEFSPIDLFDPAQAQTAMGRGVFTAYKKGSQSGRNANHL